MPGAAIYCRISRDRAGAGLGVERQEADCRALAERLELPVEAVLVDNDLSAYSGKKRPGYEALLNGVKSGQYTAILAWHADRLHRNPKELERFIDLIEAAHIPVHTVTAGEVDLATPSGRAVARTLGAWARYESEHKSERIRRKHLELAEKGLPNGGHRPYGYMPDRVTVCEPEAEIVREMCQRLLAGDSLRTIAADLNRRNVPTVTGKQWYSALIRQTVLRPRNIGMRERNKTVFAKAAWPGIVPEDIWTATCALLTDQQRRTAWTYKSSYLLSGIAKCGVCGAPVRVSNHKKDGKPVYRCSAGICVSRRVAPVDELVVAVVIELLSHKDARTLFIPKSVTARDYVGEIAVLRQRQRDAAVMFARGTIDGRMLEQVKRDIDGQLETLTEQSVAAHPAQVADLIGTRGEVETRWETLTLDRRRAVIDRLITITVMPTRKGRGFDPKSIRLERR